jgi:putative membrane protein insertion efficiency factor
MTPARIAQSVLVLYKKTLSCGLPPACRFYPSCADYAHEVIARYGLARGLWYALGRIARCHPWHPGGNDPVR